MHAAIAVRHVKSVLHEREQIIGIEHGMAGYFVQPFTTVGADISVSAGVHPRIMGIGPVEAVPKVLKQAGMNLSDISLIELNEAFASQALAVIRMLELDPSIVNINGGAIALGHPLGATGTRLVLTLLLELRRRNKKMGLATACIGGGQGIAIIVEAL